MMMNKYKGHDSRISVAAAVIAILISTSSAVGVVNATAPLQAAAKASAPYSVLPLA
jgi:hypothetical protein